MGSKIGPPGTPDFPGGARGAGKFPGARGAEFPPSGRGVPGPRIWGFPRDRGETRKMGKIRLLLIIWIREMGKFALREGEFRGFLEIWRKSPRRGGNPGFPRPPEKSRNFQGAVFGGGRNAKIDPIRRRIKCRFSRKVILLPIGPSVIYCRKNLENLTNFVPTGRVIKYPTKCALFPSHAGWAPREGPREGGGTPDLTGKSVKFADFLGFPGSVLLILWILPPFSGKSARFGMKMADFPENWGFWRPSGGTRETGGTRKSAPAGGKFPRGAPRGGGGIRGPREWGFRGGSQEGGSGPPF